MRQNRRIIAILIMWTIIIATLVETDRRTINKQRAVILEEKLINLDINQMVADRIKRDKEEQDSLFEVAVQIIKKYEGWHTAKNYPYVGYGHRLLPTDNFNHNISEEFAEQVLREDLKKKCAEFSEFGKDSLLLGTLAYNIGEYNIKGGYGRRTSELFIKLKNGDRDIYESYVSFRKWNGRVIPSIERRRIEEFTNLFIGGDYEKTES